MEATGDTPLSDLMAAYSTDRRPATFKRFLEAFRQARLGVIGTGAPKDAVGEVTSTSDRPLSVGLTTHANGKPMVLAFADPVAFARRFGQQFNADMAGEAVLHTALLNEQCMGILVNSALSETSIVINRATVKLLVKSAVSPARRARKPWWRFW
jgi:hypothetical protein